MKRALGPAPASVKRARMLSLTSSKVVKTPQIVENIPDVAPDEKTTEKTVSKRPPPKKILRPSNCNRYQCDQCEFRTTRQSTLTMHILGHKKLPFRCQMCRRKFAEKDLYDLHMRIHENQCDKCKKKFTNQAEWKKHKETCILNTYECYLCQHSSVKLGYLIHHMFKHTGNNPFACHLCPSKFSSKKYYDKHMKSIHH